jgi:hypothetical protein
LSRSSEKGTAKASKKKSGLKVWSRVVCNHTQLHGVDCCFGDSLAIS